MAELNYENCPECGHLNEVESSLGLTFFNCEECGTDWILCGDCGEWIDEEMDWDKDAMLCNNCADEGYIYMIAIDDVAPALEELLGEDGLEDEE